LATKNPQENQRTTGIWFLARNRGASQFAAM
jgi:hypothetical protein